MTIHNRRGTLEIQVLKMRLRNFLRQKVIKEKHKTSLLR